MIIRTIALALVPVFAVAGCVQSHGHGRGSAVLAPGANADFQTGRPCSGVDPVTKRPFTGTYSQEIAGGGRETATCRPAADPRAAFQTGQPCTGLDPLTRKPFSGVYHQEFVGGGSATATCLPKEEHPAN